MKLGIVIPSYKRPELLAATLASLREEHLRQPIPVLVVDDGTPVDALGPLVPDCRGVRMMRIEHGGIVAAQAAGIARLLSDHAEVEAVLLLAADHVLPAGWATAIADGAAAGIVPGVCEIGQIEHVPGLKRVEGWRAGATPIRDGLAVRTGLDCWHVTCSMPALMGRRAAASYAAFIDAGGRVADRRQPHSAQKTFQAHAAARFPGQPFFALLGPAVLIDHVGHASGQRPGFIRSPQHEAYYQEVGRR